MHTGTRIGVSVGLRARKCMHLRMHTDCIQSAYKHIKSKKGREFFFYFFFILPVSMSSTARDLQAIILLFASSGIPQRIMNDFHCLFSQTMGFSGFHRPSDGLSAIIPTHFLNLRSSCVPAGVYAFRPFYRLHRLNGRSKKLYALYASKNRLCMLCGNTTPELTAYNAYRNANRRVRRAEGLKMYAVGDAYKAHTECIQVSTNT